MTDRMRMETPDLTEKNIEKIAELFPNCITESKDEKGNLKKAINFDILKQMLSKEIVDGDEAYEFTWVGKKAAMLEANKSIRKTLRPCPEESLNWDTTQNLYIEGDNLDVLKLLQESYLGKVKMIYIDPPYNTGNDFIYKDDFAQSVDEYEAESGQTDEEGNRLFKNSDTNGRYHSNWCSMMYSRLSVARSLLSDDGVIFISIDDNEVENLKKICDEIFGSSNFISQMVWQRAFAPKNDSKYASTDHDYILIFGKSISNFVMGRLPRTEEANARYKNYDNDPRGVWTSDNLTAKTYSEKYDYPITTPSGKIVNPAHGSCWRVSKERLAELIADNRIWFGDKGDNVPRLKRFLSEVQSGMVASTFMQYKEVGHSQEGRQELKKLFDDKGYFDGPKPVKLLNRLLILANLNKDSIILDFFSGSATTAHAVMQLNAEDGGNRKFIMVQLQEPCDEKSEAYKAGFKNICEIGKERIRRAGRKILEEYSKSSKCEDALKPLLEEGNKRGGDRIRSLFSSLEQPSSQEDWIATQSATARNDGNSTGGSNTLSLNKVSSNSVTLSACKQATSPQGEALEPLATTGSTNDNNITQHSNAENNPLLSHLSSLNSKETGLPRSLTTARNDGNGTEQQLDVGFRVFKLADSNMKDVYYSADEYSQQSLQDFVSNIKEDRTDLDLLFGCLLEWGLPLSMPYSSEKINGFNIHTYNDGDLIACFDENVSEEVIKIIAKRNPLRAVFRDSSFANSPSKINVTEIFKLLSPNTRVKVI